MFFCKSLRVIAALGLLLGGFQALIGFGVALEFMPEAALRRYTTSTSSGMAIDRGLMVVGIAFLAGAIAEIGIMLRDRG